MNTGKRPEAREQPDARERPGTGKRQEAREQPGTGKQPEARIFRTERGIPAVEIGGMTIHSLRNPRREAEKLMKGMVDPAAPGLLVFGMGLVYHLDALKRLFPQKECVCFEPNSNWPARLAGCGLMEPARQIITPETPDWQELLKDFFQNSYQLVALKPYRRAYPQLFDEVQTLQKVYGSRKNMNRNTLKRFGSRWVENLLSNFLFLEEQRSINEMRGMFFGFPALLLAGGPTLEAVLPLLPELRVRMIILAVDTALPRCRESGVEPDFLMVVDPQYWNTKHFEHSFQELPPPQNRSILISESSAHPRTFRLIGTVPYFCGSLFPLGALFEQALPPRDRLGSGGSVSTTAWDFLKYIGTSTIYIAGMDMGFPGQRTHFHGSYFEEMIAMSGTALSPAETAAVDYLYSGNPKYRKTFSGETLLSDSRMDLFCQWFEKRLKDERLKEEIDKTDSAKTFALSSKSRRIPGMPQTTPEKLLSLPDIRMKITSLMRELKNRSEKSAKSTRSAAALPTTAHQQT
ncbi:MAG: motility associated factor glycosyltransferase family protein, partial [Salinispira sp.]